VLSRYYPTDLDMHSFENVTSTELKRANWMVLEKLFKVCCGLPVSAVRGSPHSNRCFVARPRQMAWHGMEYRVRSTAQKQPPFGAACAQRCCSTWACQLDRFDCRECWHNNIRYTPQNRAPRPS
jgi:hypothetical protein